MCPSDIRTFSRRMRVFPSCSSTSSNDYSNGSRPNPMNKTLHRAFIGPILPNWFGLALLSPHSARLYFLFGVILFAALQSHHPALASNEIEEPTFNSTELQQNVVAESRQVASANALAHAKARAKHHRSHQSKKADLSASMASGEESVANGTSYHKGKKRRLSLI